MSYYTMSNKELSQLIRRTLKENGFTSKDLSIKVRSVLYDTSVNISIKNPLVRLSEVEKVANKFSEVDYDEYSQETLAGCNVYIHCQYEFGIFNDVIKELVPIAEKVLANEEKYSGRAIANNENKEVHIMHMDGIRWALSEFDKKQHDCSSFNYCIFTAQDLAVAMWRFKNLGTIYA